MSLILDTIYNNLGDEKKVGVSVADVKAKLNEAIDKLMNSMGENHKERSNLVILKQNVNAVATANNKSEQSKKSSSKILKILFKNNQSEAVEPNKNNQSEAVDPNVEVNLKFHYEYYLKIKVDHDTKEAAAKEKADAEAKAAVEAKEKAAAEAKEKEKAPKEAVELETKEKDDKSLNEVVVPVQNAPQTPVEPETKEKKAEAEKIEEKKAVNNTSTLEEVTYQNLGGGFFKDAKGHYVSRISAAQGEILPVVTAKSLLPGNISNSLSRMPSIPKPILAGAGAVFAVGALGMIAFGIAFATGDVSSFQFFAKLSMDIVIGAAAATAVVGLATGAAVAKAGKKPVHPEGFEMTEIYDTTRTTVDVSEKGMFSKISCFSWGCSSKKSNNLGSINNNNNNNNNNVNRPN